MQYHDLLLVSEVCEFFGGSRPLNPSTLYRGIKEGRYPRPIKIGPGSSRWLRTEYEAARDRLVAKRDEAAA
jgi:predicted DNA-binding transcriptional regulator AlpA